MMGSFNYGENEILEINKNKKGIFRIKRFLNVFFVFAFIVTFVMIPIISEAAVSKTTKIKISKTSVSVYKGQKYKISATKVNKKVKHKSIKWSTSNKKVVTVNQKGYIKGLKKGTAYVYCKVKWKNNKTTTVRCKVKVYNPVKTKSFKLNKTSIKLKPGESTTLKRVIKPSNATITKVAYATGNKKVATVTSKGVVKATGVGTTKICCAIKTYNGKVYKKYATVKVWVPVTGVTFDKTLGSLYVGQSTTIKALVAPTNATYNGVTYKSSNTSVATVKGSASNKTGASTATVTAVGVGTADITVTTENGKVATYKLTVLSPYEIKMDKTTLELKEETSGNVTATVIRKYGDAKVIVYSSSDAKVATVDKDGQVVAISEGKATITATILNPTKGVPDKYNKAKTTVNVTKPDESLKYTHEPYVSTYYFDPKPDCNKDVIIPIYVTDTQHSNYLKEDNSKRFDILVEVDGEKKYVRDSKPGDQTVNLGKLTKGRHYFALQVIDKKNGLKSHKLYYDLDVVDDEEKIKESEIYYMTESDLERYGIDNTNKTGEDICIQNKNGLNTFLSEKASEGYRKVVLLKGTYRVDGEDDRSKGVRMPSNLTLDLNQSIIKLNTVEENSTGVTIFIFDNVTNAHITNGTLEGDRFERRDMGLETDDGYGEGINTVIFRGGKHCSISNMTIKQTTGHTVGSQYVWGPQTRISSYTKVEIIDGSEVSREDVSTSNMIDITANKEWSGYIAAGKAIGYQGTQGLSQIIYMHFYDKDQEYISSVTAHQFRKIKIPEAAYFVRVSIYGDLNYDNNVIVYSKQLPECVTIRDIDFIDTRTTAIAISSCNSLLIENVRYTRAGNSITPCAVDFEDGWEECQDVYYRNNEVIEESGTCTLIDCAGFNHIYENNKGHKMNFRRRVKGLQVKDNDDSKSDIVGFIQHEQGNGVISKYNRIYNNKVGLVSVTVKDSDIEKGAEKMLVKNCQISKIGMTYTPSEVIHVISTPSHVTYTDCIFKTFYGNGMRIENSVIYPYSYLGDNLYFKNCEFKNFDQEGGEMIFKFNQWDGMREFDNCRFIGKTKFYNSKFNSVKCSGCYFEDLIIEPGVCTEEYTKKITFNNCEINSTAEDFIKTGPFDYSEGRIKIEFDNCLLNLSNGNLLKMYAVPTTDSEIVFNNCKINKEEGVILGASKSTLDSENASMKVRFIKCQINGNLDYTYDGVSKKVLVEVQ